MRYLKKSHLAKHIGFLMVVIMGLVSLVPPVNASFISSENSVTNRAYTEDLKIISNALENKIVKQRLNDLGYTDDEIREHLNQLSNEEIHGLALQMDALNQGGVLGFVISVLVIVVLVLVIFRLT